MSRWNYEVGAISRCGNVRDVNQDAYLVQKGMLGNDKVLLLAVADGMGGVQQGELASQMVVDALKQWWFEDLPVLCEQDISWNSLQSSIVQKIDQVNRMILTLGREQGIKTGTTLTLALLLRGTYLLFQVGDSRAYLGHNGCWKQLTRDQTWCQQELEAGRLSVEEIQSHPRRNILVSSLGSKETYLLECLTGEVVYGDSLVLCSDGFYHEAPRQWVGEEPQIQDALEWAADFIEQGRAADNLTAVAVRVTQSW